MPGISLRKITLFTFILWAAIGMSVAAIYIPVSSDPAEAQKPVFERPNPLQQNGLEPLTTTLNSTLTNGTNVDLSLQILSPLIALVQVQLDALTGNAPFVSLIQVKLEPTVVNTDKEVSSDKSQTENKPVEPPKDVETKTNTTTTNTTVPVTNITDTNTTNTTGTNSTIPVTNTTDTNTTENNTNATNNTTETNGTDPVTGNKYLVDNFSLEDKEYIAEITNQNDNVVGDGYFEISTNAASNHLDVLQSGTFAYALGTFTISDVLTFNPVDNTEYYIHVYTNYPEEDNRVSKDNIVFIYSENESA
jgi:hypothetical protein